MIFYISNQRFYFHKYGFVFGITNLAAFISAPLVGVYGENIGAKRLYNFGTFLQALCAIAFGFLEYVDNTALFLGLSYLLRYENLAEQ